MEIKRPEEITEADIPNIEYPLFAAARVKRVFDGFGALYLFGTKTLDEIVKGYMPKFLGGDERKLSAYWKYYKWSGREEDWEYRFHQYDPVKDQVLKDFKWGKYLVVLQTEEELFRSCTLFRKDERPHIKPHDRWRQYGDALPTIDYMGFEDILNRVYPDRKRLDYHPFYGPGSGAEETTEEITLSPEPWPTQNTSQATAFSATAQPIPQPSPNKKPPTETEPPRGPASNDPEFNPRKAMQLGRVLGAIPAILVGY